MRILDINGNELLEEDIDLKEGHLEPEQLFIVHHDAVPAVSRQTHFRVKEVFFSDSSYIPVSAQDPHIIVIDAKVGQFQYRNLEGEEPKKARGMSLEEIVDREASEAIPAWDEYEDILRYILYTPAEKQAKEEQEEQARKREEFLNNGLARLEALENSNNTINTTIATQAANIISLETTMTNSMLEMSQNITNIENNVANVNDEIASVNDNLTTYAENLDSQSENLSDLSATVSNHTAELETQSLSFDQLQENVDLMDERVINAEEVMTVNTDEIHGIDDILQVTNETVDDLVLTMADILGMNESEEEEEPIEE